MGGISFARGALAHLLRNRFYIGEVTFKGRSFPANNRRLSIESCLMRSRLGSTSNSTVTKVSRSKSEALLVGRIFDDRGNEMTPSHARKNGTKYRYYISSVLVQGQGERAGTVNRIPAADVEPRIIKAVRSQLVRKTTTWTIGSSSTNASPELKCRRTSWWLNSQKRELPAPGKEQDVT